MAEQIELLVQPERLIRAADRVSRLTCSLHTDFEDMQNLAARSSYYWEGPAANAFRREFAGLKQETQEILARFGAYPEDLLRMAGLYEQTEQKTAEAAAGLPTDIL